MLHEELKDNSKVDDSVYSPSVAKFYHVLIVLENNTRYYCEYLNRMQRLIVPMSCPTRMDPRYEKADEK